MHNVDKNDPAALYRLGNKLCYDDGIQFYWRALVVYREAALLGHVLALRDYGEKAFASSNPERYYWLGQFCRKTGDWGSFMYDVKWQLLGYNQHGTGGLVLLMMGRMLLGYVRCVTWSYRCTADDVVHIYKSCMGRAKQAVVCWLLCARYIGLYKDVACLVAQDVWADRHTFMGN